MAHYMRGIADKAWAAGWDVVRLNQRNCGGTERLSRGLYHSGLTHDVRHVVRELLERDRCPRSPLPATRSVATWRSSSRVSLATRRRPVLGVCAVSPAMDLAAAWRRLSGVELPVRVELRPQSQGADAPKGGGVSR